MNCQKSSLKEFFCWEIFSFQKRSLWIDFPVWREEATKTEKVDNLLAQLEEQRKAMMHVRKPGDFSSRSVGSALVAFDFSILSDCGVVLERQV